MILGAQRRSTIPVAAKSKARRTFVVTYLAPTHEVTQTISGRLYGLTSLSRNRPSFSNIKDARRYSQFRMTLPIRHRKKEGRISKFDVRAITGPTVRREASYFAMSHFL